MGNAEYMGVVRQTENRSVAARPAQRCCVPAYLFNLIQNDWKGRSRQFPKSEDSD